MATDGHRDLFADWSATLADLSATGALLGWDRETGMPRGGAEARARQMGTLSALHHRELVRADAGEAIAALAEGDLDADTAAMVAWARRERDRATQVPEELVRELSEARSRAVSVWLDARPRDDDAAYLDGLRPVVDLTRRYAEAVRGDAAELSDALLDDYEPGATAGELEPLLDELAAGVRPLVEPATAASPPPLPEAIWPADAQVALAREVGAMIGFDLERGAIARSAHPFTTSIGAGDVRFTTRVDEADPVSNIRAVLHEAGHALYEQGLPERLAGTFAHDAPSLGAHESQSLFWENHVGRTDGFWRSLEPTLRALFPEAMGTVGIDRLARTSRRVQPSLIRVEADEVTYNLHIVLRFRLELALVRGDLPLDELPGAFDDGMEELLGLRPPRPGDGVMQDIHWPQGLIGYFPTYSLGHLYAAQLAETAAREAGPLSDLAAEGSFAPILDFLRRAVHSRARLVRTDELMRDANGAGLATAPFIEHLRRQYLREP